MNRFVFPGIALVVVLVAPVSAGTVYRYLAPPSQSLPVAVGEINEDGLVLRGTGFTAYHVGTGRYAIRFQSGYFPTGCASMIVGAAVNRRWTPFVGTVTQHNCNSVFYVTLWFPNENETVDHSFQFIAVED